MRPSLGFRMKGLMVRALIVMALFFAAGHLTGPAGFGLKAAHALEPLQRFELAVRSNDLGFLDQMAQFGLGPKSRDALGNSLLMLAVREDSLPIVDALLNSPDWRTFELLELENNLGENAMMMAALKGSVPMAQRLIKAGAQTNRAGWAPLHYAATEGQVAMIRFLVEHHAYVDTLSPNGTTPLMMAARFNRREAATELLKLGADPTLVNEAGLSARSYAERNEDQDLAFWLELEEISFTNRYLRNVPKPDLDKVFSPPEGLPARPAGPAQGVQVLPGIR